ncbi:arabinofuranosidase catalytic domain-containing protein [Nonomuraea sp. NPDC005650]|uniref:arabinofuranosidase catalytic domain-containing protein n=1 Tax=Nonomuraea sp. NPDC005650 TaxID=3157045 RepID=UPI0033B09D3D
MSPSTHESAGSRRARRRPAGRHPPSQAAASQSCDIYAAGGTPCVAAHSTTRALYAAYNGALYQVRRSSDNATQNIGNGTMEAIYFGNIKVWGYGTGNGPWVMADLENGLFSGVNAGYNANNPTVNHRYLTAIVKGEPNHWAIRAGNAQSGNLSTYYNGSRPNVADYNPMKKEGAIILGIGGDNSNSSAGTFYEGVMTSGSSSVDKNDATWIVRNGLAYSACVSFESKNYPGSYLRHSNYQLYRNANDATFCAQPGLNGQGLSWASFNYPNRLLRHYNNIVYIGSEGGSNTFDSATSWADDVSWIVASPWA